MAGHRRQSLTCIAAAAATLPAAPFADQPSAGQPVAAALTFTPQPAASPIALAPIALAPVAATATIPFTAFAVTPVAASGPVAASKPGTSTIASLCSAPSFRHAPMTSSSSPSPALCLLHLTLQSLVGVS